MGALQSNEISENGVGVILGVMSEEAAGSWLLMNENGRESALIRIFGGNNELYGNFKADLCPPDYPWPPGFRK